jgi:hypothetical protein
MKKTIYNVAVLMDSQSQCDRMKQVCIDNGLPIWEDNFGWIMRDKTCVFAYSENYNQFFIYTKCGVAKNHSYVTESEFIELLKQEKA